MNPCLQCGACCAHFRVSFYWAEAEVLALPADSIEKVNSHLACLAGTQATPPRCHALLGEVGGAVRCARYEQRPSPCQEVIPGDAQCSRARAAHGLPPLTGDSPPLAA